MGSADSVSLSVPAVLVAASAAAVEAVLETGGQTGSGSWAGVRWGDVAHLSSAAGDWPACAYFNVSGRRHLLV